MEILNLNMEDAKKGRSGKRGTVTHRINELHGEVNDQILANELKEKIKKLKDSMEELGVAQDALINSIPADDNKENDIEVSMVLWI